LTQGGASASLPKQPQKIFAEIEKNLCFGNFLPALTLDIPKTM